MAVLTLETPTAYTISYTISDMTPEYVDTAKLVLYKVGESESIRTITHRSIDVAHTTSLFGFFGGLEPETNYRVHSNIYDKDGNQTSDREDYITTPAAFKGTLNGPIHSIEIKTATEVFNTFENWGLVAAEQPCVTPPSLKSEYVDLPATNGVLDYTEILLGDVPFGRRTGSWKFYTDEFKMASLGLTWNLLYNQLLATIHGQECTITLDDDLDYYYKGRVSVNQWKSLAAFSEIVLDYNLESYKRSYRSSDDDDWQWDAAIESPDYQILYGNYAVQEFKAINLINQGDQSVIPTIEVSGSSVSGGVKYLPALEQLAAEVYRGDWGAGQERKDRLEAAGFDYDVVQAAVSAKYYGYSGYNSNITEEDIAKTTRALIANGYANPKEGYELIEGTNLNENISLTPGFNILFVFGDLDSHTKYSEESL